MLVHTVLYVTFRTQLTGLKTRLCIVPPEVGGGGGYSGGVVLLVAGKRLSGVW